jgi:hypothetical protein
MHQESKYLSYFEQVRESIQAKCPELLVLQNEIPESMQSQYYTDSTSGAGSVRGAGRMKFPRTGAFEILFRGEYIFSKLGEGIWPHPGLVSDNLRATIDGVEIPRRSPRKISPKRKLPSKSAVSFHSKPTTAAGRSRPQLASSTLAPKVVPAQQKDSSSSSDEEQKSKALAQSYEDEFEAEDKPPLAKDSGSKKSLDKVEVQAPALKASGLKADESHHSLTKEESKGSLQGKASEPMKSEVPALPKEAPQSHQGLAKEESKGSLQGKASEPTKPEVPTLPKEDLQSHQSTMKEERKASEPPKPEVPAQPKEDPQSSSTSLIKEEPSDREERKGEVKRGDSPDKQSEVKGSKHDSEGSDSDHEKSSSSSKSSKGKSSSDSHSKKSSSDESEEEDLPKVIKSYSITIGLSQISHKKIPYKNEESEDKEYEIKSSHPELMDVKDSVVHVAAGANGKFKLTFAAVEEEMERTFYLYVTSNDEVKECIEIITKYESAKT